MTCPRPTSISSCSAWCVPVSCSRCPAPGEVSSWHADQTGYLLYDAMWRAAERGVRVRILLDDANTGGLDETIAALDAHPNIEVRLYNPLTIRNARLLNFVTDFAQFRV